PTAPGQARLGPTAGSRRHQETSTAPGANGRRHQEPSAALWATHRTRVKRASDQPRVAGATRRHRPRPEPIDTPGAVATILRSIALRLVMGRGLRWESLGNRQLTPWRRTSPRVALGASRVPASRS
ncbi:MAG TPA: hypothetical protein VF456_00070, partial [Vicinamibacterales bacterium]